MLPKRVSTYTSCSLRASLHLETGQQSDILIPCFVCNISRAANLNDGSGQNMMLLALVCDS